jgi:HK97 family phage major capsid protein
MATKVQEAFEKLEVKRKELAEIFEKYPNMDMDEKVAKDIKARNDELTDLGKKWEEVKALSDIEEKNRKAQEDGNQRKEMGWQKVKPGDAAPREEEKSFGQMVVESKAFTEYKKGSGAGPAFELDGSRLLERKALFDTSTGYAPQAVRIPKLVDYAVQRPMVVDLIPQGPTDQNAIPYMEETTLTNAAVEVLEGGAYPDSALGYTEKSSTVRKIATYLPVTDEALEDVPMMASLIDNRLSLFLRMREETQVIGGDGNAPNLRGILNVVNVQVQAKGADPTPDTIYKAITKVQVSSFLPADGFVTHPTDWQDIRLLRTVDGIYIWGSPADPGPDRIWGLPVIKTTSITVNTGLVGAFGAASQIFRKKMITIQISNSHDDYFIKGKLAVRADERIALVVYRPAAFCMTTGI